MINPVIDNVGTLGDTLLLVDITKRFKQKENKETGKFEKTDDFSHVYTVVCLEKKPLFPLDEKGKAIELPDQCLVEFENLTIRPYVRDGWIQLSATADRCTLVNVE